MGVLHVDAQADRLQRNLVEHRARQMADSPADRTAHPDRRVRRARYHDPGAAQQRLEPITRDHPTCGVGERTASTRNSSVAAHDRGRQSSRLRRADAAAALVTSDLHAVRIARIATAPPANQAPRPSLGVRPRRRPAASAAAGALYVTISGTRFGQHQQRHQGDSPPFAMDATLFSSATPGGSQSNSADGPAGVDDQQQLRAARHGNRDASTPISMISASASAMPAAKSASVSPIVTSSAFADGARACRPPPPRRAENRTR